MRLSVPSTSAIALSFTLGLGCSERAMPPPPDGGAPRDGSVADGGSGSGAPVLTRLSPASGPAEGDNQLVIDGSGFDDSARVEVDGTFVAAARVRSTGPGRLVVRMPAHAPGTAPVLVETDRGRSNALEYAYEALTVSPARGSDRGGLAVLVIGAGFATGDEVLFGGAPCRSIEVRSATEIACRTPEHAPGSVDVEVRGASGSKGTAADAFTYETWDRARGGFTTDGPPIDGELTVTVYQARYGSPSGAPIAGALVQIGPDPATALRGRTGADGSIVFRAVGLRGPLDVHVGHPCTDISSAIGVGARFVDFTLTQRRTSTDDPACGRDDGSITPTIWREGPVSGRLVWSGSEFDAPVTDWLNVPPAPPGKERVAYVLPTPAGLDFDAMDRVTEADLDGDGYAFTVKMPIGAGRVLAVAGHEITGGTGEAFEPMVAGLSDAVLAVSGAVVDDIVIRMLTPLTRTMVVTVEPPPGGSVDGILYSDFLETIGDSFDVYSFETVSWPMEWFGIGPSWRSASGDLSSRELTMPGLPEPIGAFAHHELEMSFNWERSQRRLLVPPATRELLVDGFLPFPRFESHPYRSRLEPGAVFRFGLDATVDVCLVDFVPARTGGEGLVREWHVYATGTTREFEVPRASEPELHLAPRWTSVDLTVAVSPGFDFHHFQALRTASATSSSNGTVLCTADRGVSCE